MLFFIIHYCSCCSYTVNNVFALCYVFQILHFTANLVSIWQMKFLDIEWKIGGSCSLSSLPLTWASLLTAAPHLLSVSRTRMPSKKGPITKSVPLLTPTTTRFGTAWPQRPRLPPAIHWTQSTTYDVLLWDHVLAVRQSEITTKNKHDFLLKTNRNRNKQKKKTVSLSFILCKVLKLYWSSEIIT